MNGGRGFTLIELMVSVAILGVLTAIAIPFYLGYRDRAMHTVVIVDLKNIQQEIDLYVGDNGQYPDSLDEIGLDSLRDPWGTPYQYLRIDGADIKGVGKLRKDHFMVPVNTDYDLYSMGPDGDSKAPFTAKASRDDIVRAFNGAFFGKVSDF